MTVRLHLALAATLAATSATAFSRAALAAPAPGGLPVHHVLPIGLVLDATKVALATCRGQGIAIAVAFVDPKGGLQMLAADPDVSPISVELSQRKARAAALFKARSGEVGTRFQANPAYAQAMTAVDPRIAGAQGAVPVVVAGELVGALGASGAPGGDKDEACVTAGLASIADRLH